MLVLLPLLESEMDGGAGRPSSFQSESRPPGDKVLCRRVDGLSFDGSGFAIPGPAREAVMTIDGIDICLAAPVALGLGGA